MPRALTAVLVLGWLLLIGLFAEVSPLQPPWPQQRNAMPGASFAAVRGGQVDGDALSIEDNAVLRDLQAVSSLESVGGNFTIVNNPNLATCEAQWLEAHAEPRGEIVISGNDDRGVCVP